MDSIDIILNALDNTAPATATAVENFDALGEAVERTNQQIAASETAGGLSSLLGGLIAIPSLTTVAALAFAGFSVALAANVGGIRDSVIETIDSLTSSSIDWSGVWDSVVRGIVTGLAVVEYGFTNWQTVGTYTLVSIELAAVRFGAQVTHLFTEVIPKTLLWLWDNWRDIWQTMWDFTRTVITNLYENLVDFFANVILWLSGEQTDFKWTGLTEGFKSSIKELPDILEREKGPLEQQLEQIQQDLANGIVAGADENIRRRVAQIPDLVAGIKSGIKSAAGGAGDFLSRVLGLDGAGGSKTRIQFDLPTLESDRFTTGVQASAQESVAAQIAELNRNAQDQKGLMQQIADFLRGQLPREIRDGVKAGAAVAKSQGYTLPK
jgi:hypothetical protein